MPQDKWSKYIVADSTAKKWEKYATPEPEPPKPLSWGDVPGQALSNLPESALNLGKNLIAPLTNPVETAKGLGNLAKGVLSNVTPGSIPGVSGQEQFAPLINFYAERYGGMDNLKRTIAQDPAGFLSDLSTVLTGGAAMATKGGTVSKVLGTAAKATDPIAAIPNAMRAVTPTRYAERLYDSALKPSTTISTAERAKMASTGLSEGVVPTQKGLKTLQSKIDILNNQIASKIDAAGRAGTMIDANEVVKRLDDIKAFYGRVAAPSKFMKEIDDVKADFLTSHGGPSGLIPIQEAQKIKQATYSVLHKHYGELAGASKEAMKNIARGLKEEIYTQYPELKLLNEREGALIGLEDAIENAVNRGMNKEVIPTGSVWTAGAVGLGTGQPGMVASAFVGKSLIEHPLIKAKLAIALNKVRQNRFRGGTLPPFATAGRDLTNTGR